jgi:mannose-1-phosphate guanylyltransferase/mannose-6-phosphate isomerase
MKCILLAGGSGNRLWPLSRKSFPKQFLNVTPDSSLLQETVRRNLNISDEFLVLTNSLYKSIIDGQMQIFPDVKYRCFYEEMGRNTAPAIALACLTCKPDDIVFIVSSDHMIGNELYGDSIKEAVKLASEGALVTFGIKPIYPHTGYGYIHFDGENVLQFKEKPDYETAEKYVESGEYLWNSGMFMFKAGIFLKELKKFRKDIYDACKTAIGTVSELNSDIVLTEDMMTSIPSESVDYAVFEKSDLVKTVAAEFSWCDVGNLEIFSEYINTNGVKNVIESDSANNIIINSTSDKLVVINKLEDLLVVNTDDAIFISKKGKSEDIKNIMSANPEFKNFFE